MEVAPRYTLFALFALLSLLTFLPLLTLLKPRTLSFYAFTYNIALWRFGLRSKKVDYVSGWTGLTVSHGYPFDCYDY